MTLSSKRKVHCSGDKDKHSRTKDVHSYVEVSPFTTLLTIKTINYITNISLYMIQRLHSNTTEIISNTTWSADRRPTYSSNMDKRVVAVADKSDFGQRATKSGSRECDWHFCTVSINSRKRRTSGVPIVLFDYDEAFEQRSLDWYCRYVRYTVERCYLVLLVQSKNTNGKEKKKKKREKKKRIWIW